MSLLAAHNLRKSFAGIAAVADVSFALAIGEILALIGPNGAGKSTCFNLLTGQLQPDAGQVIFDGRDITGRAPGEIWRLGISRSFQIAATFKSMSVRENVQMTLLSHRREIWNPYRRAARWHADEAGRILAQLGMAELAELPCASLAYGDLKRLELAIVIANQPRLLLMDEPTAGMAQAERQLFMTLLRELAQTRQIAVLFTEHDMGAVFTTADRVLVLDQGMLIAEGPPEAIRADPRVRAVYLGEDTPG